MKCRSDICRMRSCQMLIRNSMQPLPQPPITFFILNMFIILTSYCFSPILDALLHILSGGNKLSRAAIHHKINETLSGVKECRFFIISLLCLCLQTEREWKRCKKKSPKCQTPHLTRGSDGLLCYNTTICVICSLLTLIIFNLILKFIIYLLFYNTFYYYINIIHNLFNL